MKKYPMFLLSSVVLLFALPCRTLAQSLDELIAQRDQLVAQRSALQNDISEYVATYNELTEQYNAIMDNVNSGDWLNLWEEYRGLLMSISAAEDSISELRQQLDMLASDRNEAIDGIYAKYDYWDSLFREDDPIGDFSDLFDRFPGGLEQLDSDRQEEIDAVEEYYAWQSDYTEFRIECINDDIAWMKEDLAWYESMMDGYYSYQSEAESIEDQRSYINGVINSMNQEIAELNRRISDLDAAIRAW